MYNNIRTTHSYNIRREQVQYNMHASALHQSSLSRSVDSHFESGSCNLEVREMKIVIIEQQFDLISDVRRVYSDLVAYKPKDIKSKMSATQRRMTLLSRAW